MKSVPFCQHLELHILCACHLLDFLSQHSYLVPCPTELGQPSFRQTPMPSHPPITPDALTYMLQHPEVPGLHTQEWLMQACSSLWPRRPAPGRLSSEKVPQGSVSPTPLDVSDFLLTCNKLSNRFKSFWDNTDRQPAKSHQCCFLSKQE